MAATQTATKLRKDPASRHVDGERGTGKLLNRDPNRHYVFASRSNDMGEEYYLDMGFVHERTADKDDHEAVRLWRGKTSKPGEPLECKGHVLMSIELDKWEKIQQEGDGVCGGQAWVDRFEANVIRGKGVTDGLRGVDRRYAHIVENSTTPAQPE